jgi:molecular chaperone HscB
MGEKDPALAADLAAAKTKFETLLAAVDSSLHAEWNRWDAGSEAVRHEAQKSMVALLDRRRYLANLVRDVNETLGA